MRFPCSWYSGGFGVDCFFRCEQRFRGGFRRPFRLMSVGIIAEFEAHGLEDITLKRREVCIF